eukprot:6220961-Prorocentrum_lima.AAC.1
MAPPRRLVPTFSLSLTRTEHCPVPGQNPWRMLARVQAPSTPLLVMVALARFPPVAAAASCPHGQRAGAAPV